VTIRAVMRTWESQQLVTALAASILRDTLGYNVEIVYSTDSTRLVLSDMQAGMYDIDLEQWQLHNPDDVEAFGATVMGSIGYVGRSGLYVPTEVVNRAYAADYYKFYRNASSGSSRGMATHAVSTSLANETGLVPECDTASFPWCGDGRLSGYWAAPGCQQDPFHCLEVVGALPSWDTGILEQIARNNALQVVFAYYGGSAWATVVDDVLHGRRPPAVFYAWTPLPLLSQGAARRISFPDVRLDCDTGGIHNPNQGTRFCDYRPQPLLKVSRSDLRVRAPEAWQFISSFTLSEAHIFELMAAHQEITSSQGHSENEDSLADCVEPPTCEFVAKYPSKVGEWVLPCTAAPLKKDALKAGDIVYAASVMACINVSCPANMLVRASGPRGLQEENGESGINRYGLWRCRECLPGRVPDVHQNECLTCPPGSEVDSAGASCQECTRGRARSLADSECRHCPPGHFGEADAQTACTRCPIAEFQNETGSTACVPCSSIVLGSTTAFMSVSEVQQCICPWGTYKSAGGAECLPCPAGMECLAGSVAMEWTGDGYGDGDGGESHPRLLRGYMSLPSNLLKTYRCTRKEDCPGGLPGLQSSCAERRQVNSIACGECFAGSHASPGASGCVPCGGSTVVPFVASMCLGLLAVVLLTLIINKDEGGILSSQASLSCYLLLGLAITTFQILSVISRLEIEWFNPVSFFMNVLAVVFVDVKVFNFPCLIDASPALDYICQQVVSLACFPLVVIVLLLHNRFRGERKTYRLAHAINSLGALFSALFITVMLSALSPLICYAHPENNGKSMIEAPSVLCTFEGDHLSMFLGGMVSLMAIPLPLTALSVVAIICYRKNLNRSTRHKRMRKAFRFLFLRFQANAYYYGIVLLLRNLLLCLVPVVFDSVGLQVFILSAALAYFALLQLSVQPWRSRLVNVADGLINVSILMLLLSAALLRQLEVDPWEIQVCATTLLATGLGAVAVGLAVSVQRQILPRRAFAYFLCHHKADAGAQARLLKLLVYAWTGQAVFIDSDDLTDLEALFDIVKMKVRHLVVYLTSGTLTRPYCAGEIATAMKSKLKVTAVKTASFVPPSDAMLINLGTYLDMASCNLEDHGLLLDTVASCYNKFLTGNIVRWIPFPKDIQGLKRFEYVAQDIICSRREMSEVGYDSQGRATSSGNALVSVDIDSDEAIAAAYILILKIESEVSDVYPGGVRALCDFDEQRRDIRRRLKRAHAVVVILSRGSLQCYQQLDVIVTCMQIQESHHDNGHVVLPVNLWDFQFPGAGFYESSLPALWQGDVQDVTEWLRSFFLLITVTLSTLASDVVITSQAKEVTTRLRNSHQTARSRANRSGRRRSVASGVPGSGTPTAIFPSETTVASNGPPKAERMISPPMGTMPSSATSMISGRQSMLTAGSMSAESQPSEMGATLPKTSFQFDGDDWKTIQL